MLKSKVLESHNLSPKLIFKSTIINIALKIKDIEKTTVIFFKLELLTFVLMTIKPNSIRIKKKLSNIKVFSYKNSANYYQKMQ